MSSRQAFRANYVPMTSCRWGCENICLTECQASCLSHCEGPCASRCMTQCLTVCQTSNFTKYAVQRGVRYQCGACTTYVEEVTEKSEVALATAE